MINNKKQIISWLVVILWMCLIFFFSSNNGEASDSQSMGIIEVGIQITSSITHNDYDEDKIIDILNTPVRKCAHAFEYFILSLLLINAFRQSGLKDNKKSIIVILICFLYSCTDEFHQLFSMGRTAKFTDCLIDTFGSLIGYTSFMIFNYVKNRQKYM